MQRNLFAKHTKRHSSKYVHRRAVNDDLPSPTSRTYRRHRFKPEHSFDVPQHNPSRLALHHQSVEQHAVDAKAHANAITVGFKMDILGAPTNRVAQERISEPHCIRFVAASLGHLVHLLRERLTKPAIDGLAQPLIRSPCSISQPLLTVPVQVN